MWPGSFVLRLDMSDTQPAQTLDVNLLPLVAVFVKWPTFILGSCVKVCARPSLLKVTWTRLAINVAVTGASTAHDPWGCFFLFFFSFWVVKKNCKLHNNLIHPRWKHAIHKQGARKNSLTAFYINSACRLPICSNWKRYFPQFHSRSLFKMTSASLFQSMALPYCFAPLCFVGSSTACIVVLDRRSHRLHTCNLGDSGFLVVRGGEVVHRSDEQQHYFNTPFQLSIAPPGAEGVVLSDRSVARCCRHSCHMEGNLNNKTEDTTHYTWHVWLKLIREWWKLNCPLLLL